MEFALLDQIAVLQMDVLALRDQIFDGLNLGIGRLDRDAPLVLVVATEADGAGDFGDDRRLLRTPGLEQLRHPRQTAGDVAGLGALGRDTGDDVAGIDRNALVDRQDGVDGERIARLAATGELEDLALLVLDRDRRTQIRGALRRTPVGHHALGDAGGFVLRFRNRLTFDQILEFGEAVDLGDDRTGIRIPFRHTLAALDLVAFVDAQPRAERQTMGRPFAAVGIDDRERDVAAHHDQRAFRILGDGVGQLVLQLQARPFHRIDSMNDCSLICAAPPMWKVRMVSWVPGSPIDWAAITPTASPILTGRAAGKIASVAGAADAIGQLRRSAPNGCALPARWPW